MDLNNNVGPHGPALNCMFTLAKGIDVPNDQLTKLSTSQISVCRNYGAKRFDENIGGTGVVGPAVFQHMEGFVRAESALGLYRSGTMTSGDYVKFVSSENVPSYLHDYYVAIDHYRNGRVEQAYLLFDKTRLACSPMVLKYMRYFEGSIRGAMSARPLSYLQTAFDNCDVTTIDATFPIDGPYEVFTDKPIHVVGCDFAYWEKYKNLFHAWAAGLEKVAYVCLVCVDFSDEQARAVRSKYPEIMVARCSAKFTNARPFYTMTRFLVAERLMRRGASAVTCSDIDSFVEAGRYLDFVSSSPDGARTTFSRGWFPWRSVGAEFTLWKGCAGWHMLGCMASYFVEVFDPNIPAGNRQWWVDQFPIAMFADATTIGIEAVDPILRKFHPTDRAELPIKGPGDFKISKEEFARRFGAA